jgi:chitinase
MHSRIDLKVKEKPQELFFTNYVYTFTSVTMSKPKSLLLPLLFIVFYSGKQVTLQPSSGFRVVGYYSGSLNQLESFETNKLTHLIFCFGSLRDNHLCIRNANDSTMIRKMVGLKNRNPSLKVILSLGGWGGCQTCSDVFSTDAGRKAFAQSVKETTTYFKTDGIDLDWEYPAIKGFPGHRFRKEDRDNFTALLYELRKTNGASFEISFAAGGFTDYIDSSIDWKSAINYFDYINIMSYDLVHGYSRISGHHTPLYSTPQQTESTDHAVQLLLKAGVPADKLVIGAAFYGRFFQIENGNDVGLYRPCKFSHGFSYNSIRDSISEKNGFVEHWDDIAKAPYAINTKRKLLATYDDKRSIALKTKYAVENHLGGIMFWQLGDDQFKEGLLQAIIENKGR